MTKCSYCNTVGHTIRQCNGDSAKRIRNRFRRVISEEELDQLLSYYTSPMLSIVMLMYNARNVSCTKSEKIAFIKEKWLSGEDFNIQANNQVVPNQVVPVAIQEPVPEIQEFQIRELFEDLQISETIYNNVCVEIHRIPKFVIPSRDTGLLITSNLYSRVSQEFIDMILDVTENILQITRGNLTRSTRMMTFILDNLKIPKRNSIYRDVTLSVLKTVESIIRERYPKHEDLKINIVVTHGIEEKHAECAICYDDKEQVILNCEHGFCVDCLEGISKMRGNKKDICCALCRKEVTEFKVTSEITKTICENKIIKGNMNAVNAVAHR
jgi:hypothetical protein